MAASRYRGNDRRVLSKARKCLLWLDDQDEIRRDDSKKSAKISSKIEVFPLADQALIDAKALVAARIDACLAADAP